MTQINPDVAKLQIDLKEALAKLDKHMRHGQCDEQAYRLSAVVEMVASDLKRSIAAEAVKRPMVLTHHNPKPVSKTDQQLMDNYNPNDSRFV